METFWENVLRYLKFLVTSVLGLIFTIFGDSIKLLMSVLNKNSEKKNKTKILIVIISYILGIITFISIIYSILNI